MGAGRHARFSVISSGVRAKAVAFGCEGRLGADPGEPCDATFRLDRNVWNGTIEPRLVLRHAQPCSPEAIEVLDEPAGYLAAALAELGAPLLRQTEQDADADADADGPDGRRTILDRRGESPLAVLADATAGGGPMLAVCADVGRRLGGLSARIGGFALTSHHALESDPSLASRYPQLVALDPPSGERAAEILGAGSGFTHLAWGEPELRFAQQIHEQEYGLRASLATLYRSLRQAGRVTGEELERLLRGDGPHGRPPRVAGKLVRVLVELQLVSLDRDLPALEVAGTAPTALERSPAYRVYAQRYEDGRRFLSSANLRPSD
jgi:single-stranded-DNA-specific exonuclease